MIAAWRNPLAPSHTRPSPLSAPRGFADRTGNRGRLPARKVGGPAAAYVDILITQHQRGREITDYVLAVTAKGAIGTGDAEPLARALDSIELMYANHAAREDTIVFPAWKDALSAHQLDEMGDKFEDIEREQFGKDGFADAVAQIGRIEQALGLADLAQFTAPPP
jgi:hypothetical protein